MSLHSSRLTQQANLHFVFRPHESVLCPNCIKFNTALPSALRNKPAMFEVDQINSCGDMRAADRQTDRDSWFILRLIIQFYLQLDKNVSLLPEWYFDMKLFVITQGWLLVRCSPEWHLNILLAMWHVICQECTPDKITSSLCHELIWSNRINHIP